MPLAENELYFFQPGVSVPVVIAARIKELQCPIVQVDVNQKGDGRAAGEVLTETL